MSTSFGALILTQKADKGYQPAFAYPQPEVAVSFYPKTKKAGATAPA
jgi:hypothetical protein